MQTMTTRADLETLAHLNPGSTTISTS